MSSVLWCCLFMPIAKILDNIRFPVLPFGLAELHKQLIYQSATNFEAIGLLCFVLFGGTLLTYILVPMALQRLRATTVSIYLNIQPIVASFVAIWLGMDSLTWDKPVALLPVMSGTMLVILSPSETSKSPK